MNLGKKIPFLLTFYFFVLEYFSQKLGGIMNLKAEEFLCLLEKLGVNLLDPNQSKIIKEEYFSHHHFEDLTDEYSLIRFKLLLHKLGIDWNNHQNMHTFTVTLFQITNQVVFLDPFYLTSTSFFKIQEKLVEEVMQELGMPSHVQGYFFFKEAVLFILKHREELISIPKNTLFSYILIQVFSIHYHQNYLSKRQLDAVIASIYNLIHRSERYLIPNKIQVESALYIYQNYTITHHTATKYLNLVAEYVQLLEERLQIQCDKHSFLKEKSPN